MLETYERGLQAMLLELHGTPQYADALVYEQRLMENIACTRLHGDSEQLRSERAQIIDNMNRLCLRVTGHAFLDLCEQQRVRHGELLEYVAELVDDLHRMMRELLEMQNTNH